jgi:dTMP kinase
VNGSGVFVTFEGGDGSGKTTQAARLVRALRLKGYSVVRTYEPGGTPLGSALRELLLNARISIEPLAELLLFSAARAQNVETVIRPALKAGTTVVCDRFVSSTIAYQGYGKGLNLEQIKSMNELATRGLKPDLTILLDVDPEVGLTRISRYEPDGDRIGGNLQLGLDLGDPLSGKREGGWELDVHRKVREGYLSLAANKEEHWLKLDATQSEEALSAVILSHVETLITKRKQSYDDDPLTFEGVEV